MSFLECSADSIAGRFIVQLWYLVPNAIPALVAAEDALDPNKYDSAGRPEGSATASESHGPCDLLQMSRVVRCSTAV